MALSDFFKGAKHRANAERLEGELETLRVQSKAEIESLRTKANDELLATEQNSQSVILGLQSSLRELEYQISENGLLDLVEIQKKIQESTMILSDLYGKIKLAESELRTEIQKKIQEEKDLLTKVRSEKATEYLKLQETRTELKELKKKILGAEEQILLESFALYEPKYQFTNSIDYKNRLDEIREEQKRTAKSISSAVNSWGNEGAELTAAEWKKLRKDVLKLSLRSFNSESEYCIENVKFNNVEKMEARIRRSFETCNSLLNVTRASWKDLVLQEKLEELYLSHEYQVKRQQEKEAARQIREEQREQEKLEKEIREARAKIEKERRHFNAALQKLQLRLKAAESELEREDLQKRIDELSSQNNQLDEQAKLLDYREQNARAGYVYVISNIGAFGEGVYKIGMTRRLEPMDRVDELGDASVPFRFDVHAMVFSDNAPSLEAKLHARFATGRLNKINGRKEFFRADLRAIEEVIRANYDAVVEVVHTAPAEQYRESLRLTKPLETCAA